MTPPQLRHESTSVVLLGHFNPSIFTPAWFAAFELLPWEQVNEEVLELEIIHPQIVQFGADWLALTVQEDRLQASTQDPAFYPLLRDLVLGTFQLLSHTPIRGLGLNHTFHYHTPVEDDWKAISNSVSPESRWRALLNEPRTERLAKRGDRPDGREGHVNVRLEPSRRYPPGVFVQFNDHFVLSHEESGEPQSAGTVVPVLANVWEDSQERARVIVDAILRWRHIEGDSDDDE